MDRFGPDTPLAGRYRPSLQMHDDIAKHCFGDLLDAKDTIVFNFAGKNNVENQQHPERVAILTATVDATVSAHVALCLASKVKNVVVISQGDNLETLETRNSDSLDFHDLPVWSIREALLAAYHAGRESGPLPRTAPCPRCGSEVTIQQITT